MDHGFDPRYQVFVSAVRPPRLSLGFTMKRNLERGSLKKPVTVIGWNDHRVFSRVKQMDRPLIGSQRGSDCL